MGVKKGAGLDLVSDKGEETGAIQDVQLQRCMAEKNTAERNKSKQAKFGSFKTQVSSLQQTLLCQSI